MAAVVPGPGLYPGPALYPGSAGGTTTSFLSFDLLLCRVIIDVAAAVSGGGTGSVTVQRSLDQMNWVTVRGASAIPITAGTLPVSDYEFTPGVVNYYRVQQALNANTGFEGGVASWTAMHGATLSQSGLWANSGSYSALFTGNGATASPAIQTELDAVSPGDQLSFKPSLFSPQGWANVQVGIKWFTAGGTLVGQKTLNAALPAGVEAQPELLATIPAGTSAQVAAFVMAVGTPAGSVQFLADDAALVGGSARTYQDQITPVITQPWLKNLRYPFLNTAADIADASDIVRPSNSSTFAVIGRQNQVAITLPRGGRQFTLTVKTVTGEQAAAVHALLNTGDVVLLQVPAGYTMPLTGYYSAGDSTETRQAVNWARRWISAPLTETDAPAADITGAGVIWQSVVNSYATWSDLAAAQATWLDVLTLIGAPGDVITP
jgi:hypothetical protein